MRQTLDWTVKWRHNNLTAIGDSYVAYWCGKLSHQVEHEKTKQMRENAIAISPEIGNFIILSINNTGESDLHLADGLWPFCIPL